MNAWEEWTAGEGAISNGYRACIYPRVTPIWGRGP